MDISRFTAVPFIGCFITTEDLKGWIEEHVETPSENIADDMKAIIKGLTNDEDLRLLNDVLMFPREYVVNADPGTDESGWYIGVDAFNCQESASLKRIKLDLRNLLIKSNLFFEDESTIDAVYEHPVILDLKKIKVTKAKKPKQ